MNEFEITTLVMSIFALAFALWVKPTTNTQHHNSVK